MTSAQTHPAKIVSVHDGDTIKVSIPLARSRAKDRDLGFHIYVEHGWLVLHAPIRLLGCNAIELHSPKVKGFVNIADAIQRYATVWKAQ